MLLLEAGFLAIFLVPFSLAPYQAQGPPSLLFVWLARWLLFRLVFSSGFAKLASGDETWRNLTALRYHYYTQPLPNPVAWFLDKQPLWFARLSTFVSLFIELVIPFTIWLPPPISYIGAWLMIFLQVLIFASGNYNFFNLLAIALCLFLFEDRTLPHIWIPFVLKSASPKVLEEIGFWIIAVLIGFFSSCWFAFTVSRGRLTRMLIPIIRLTEPFKIASTYGLFAVMTTSRREIIIEGSTDGKQWLPYEFRYKPGDVTRPPPIVAPHQPRLDWQMWFASLQNPTNADWWFLSFCRRLLEGSPEVLSLLATNPFPAGPPQYIRAFFYDYIFSTQTVKRTTGAWWERTLIGPYLPFALSAREAGRPRPLD